VIVLTGFTAAAWLICIMWLLRAHGGPRISIGPDERLIEPDLRMHLAKPAKTRGGLPADAPRPVCRGRPSPGTGRAPGSCR
jgi:hypothetical protein